MGQCTETVLPEISAHTLIGYIRVSTDGDRQVLDLQRDALLAVGVDERHLFEDRESGRRREDVSNHLLAHLSPLGWEHINLTDDYVWSLADKITENHDGYQPLRPALDPVLLAARVSDLSAYATKMRVSLLLANPVQHRPMPLDRRQHLGPHRGQNRRIVPVRLGHDVVQRLMFGLHMGGVEPHRHRLDALALTGQQQAGAVGLRRGRPARMPQHTGNCIQISRQSRFAGQRLSCSFLIHHPYMGNWRQMT
jgi:hypothetical protein